MRSPFGRWILGGMPRPAKRKASKTQASRRSGPAEGPNVSPSLPFDLAEARLTLCYTLLTRLEYKVQRMGGFKRLSEKKRRLVDEATAVAERTFADLDRISQGFGFKALK
jgi:hypothetical protein